MIPHTFAGFDESLSVPLGHKKARLPLRALVEALRKPLSYTQQEGAPLRRTLLDTLHDKSKFLRFQLKQPYLRKAQKWCRGSPATCPQGSKSAGVRQACAAKPGRGRRRFPWRKGGRPAPRRQSPPRPRPCRLRGTAWSASRYGGFRGKRPVIALLGLWGRPPHGRAPWALGPSAGLGGAQGLAGGGAGAYNRTGAQRGGVAPQVLPIGGFWRARGKARRGGHTISSALTARRQDM